MEHINLVYWDDVDNWGDFLSPYIIGKLSGLPVRHKKLYLLGRKGQLQLLGNFILGKVVKEDLLKTLFFFERNLFGIGSILSKGNKRALYGEVDSLIATNASAEEKSMLSGESCLMKR